MKAPAAGVGRPTIAEELIRRYYCNSEHNKLISHLFTYVAAGLTGSAFLPAGINMSINKPRRSLESSAAPFGFDRL